MFFSTLTFAVLATASTLFSITHAQDGSSTYTLKSDLSYKSFFEAFDFFAGPDPTKGFVQYQTLDNATQSQLVGYFEDQQSVFMGVDHTSKDPAGRASVRLESKATLNQGLLVVDVRHMPDSTCGSWPAFWMVGTENGEVKWPDAGEIDILEGVNEDTRNAVTLHTSAGCVVENSSSPVMGVDGELAMPFLGNMATSDCDVAAEGQDKNVGCSIKAPEPDQFKGVATYGTEFNNAGGGVYAMEWTDSSISVWFFPRDSPGIAAFETPSNSTSNTTQTLDPFTFGTPLAKFQGSGCDFTERFKDLKIIFDTTFCGEWAGRVWDDTCAASTGVKTCEEYVQNNPEVFASAYWEVKALKWYQKGGAAPAGEKRALETRKNVKHFGREYRW
jgi:hypothetical protein